MFFHVFSCFDHVSFMFCSCFSCFNPNNHDHDDLFHATDPGAPMGCGLFMSQKGVGGGIEREGKRFGAIVDGCSILGSGGYYNTRENKFEI